MAPPRREDLQSDKGECSKVAKCLIRGGDGGKAGPRGHPQRVCRSQEPVQLLRKKGGVSNPTGGRLNRSLASQPGREPPPCALGVRGGVQQAHVFYKHEQGGGGPEMRPSSQDPATRWQAPHQYLIEGGQTLHIASSPGDQLP